MEKLGQLVCYIALMIYTVMVSSYTISMLWEWFIVSAFGAPLLGMAQAAGMLILVRYLTADMPKNVPATDLIDSLYYATAKPAVALLLGLIINHWI